MVFSNFLGKNSSVFCSILGHCHVWKCPSCQATWDSFSIWVEEPEFIVPCYLWRSFQHTPNKHVHTVSLVVLAGSTSKILDSNWSRLFCLVSSDQKNVLPIFIMPLFMFFGSAVWQRLCHFMGNDFHLGRCWTLTSCNVLCSFWSVTEKSVSTESHRAKSKALTVCFSVQGYINSELCMTCFFFFSTDCCSTLLLLVFQLIFSWLSLLTLLHCSLYILRYFFTMWNQILGHKFLSILLQVCLKL